MILRVSAQFQRHYKVPIEKKELPVQPFPQTWNIDFLNHGRSQHIVLVSEEYSLFSLLIPMTSPNWTMEAFLEEFRQRLTKLFENIRLWTPPDLTEFTYCGRTNRKIIGSQNELLFLTRGCWEDRPFSPASLEKAEEEINSAPLSYLGMDCPREALFKEIGKLNGCGR